MQIDMMTLGIQFALYVIISIAGYLVIMREKRIILASIDGKIQMAIDQVGEVLSEIFEKPVVKASMTNLGKQGGAAMQQKAIMNKMAMDYLDGPKIAGMKMIAKEALNIDIDQYIEEHGAIQTFQAAQQLGQLAGVDVMKFMGGGPNLSVGAEANGNHPYLGR